jgi:putative membrane protein
MVNLIIRVVINAVALFVADWLVPGMEMSDDWVNVFIVAAVFGLVNALIKPIVQLLSCPITILTLGLFTFVINALMLMLTGWLTNNLLTFESFWQALLAGILISIISTVLSMVLADNG